MNREANRLQVFFDEKPDRDTCSAMRHSGFKWAPSVGAWQRQLNDNAIYAAKHLDCLRPLSVEQPTQVPEQAEPVQEPAQSGEWGFYIIADLKTWADNADSAPAPRLTPIRNSLWLPPSSTWTWSPSQSTSKSCMSNIQLDMVRPNSG